ncbi:phosphoethanolamine transferase [Lelliottia wanjuensis]|uniref:phosphoethanolamine transferase n=1 Tax=Lelliottia wanjuensis TaxID=3050585 RepID=UPI00254C1264|nr:phosphoethanolamine transferase [Lelliottia sp. V86_10]MDK9586911.1 phosphoethanolamine transferase [Lelliottia sp. V86_10]
MSLRGNINSTGMFILASMVFSFLFNSAFGYGPAVAYSFFTFILTLTFRNEIVYFSAITLGAVIAFLYCPVGLTFGPPDLNAMTSVAYTDKAETLEFLMSISVWKWLIAVSILFSAASCCLLRKKTTFVLPRILSLLSIICFFSIPIKAAYQESQFSLLDSHYPPIRFVSDARNAYNQVNADKAFYQHNMKIPDDWGDDIHGGNYNTVVIIIGESVRRDFMSAYGFPINDTSFMQTRPGIIFTNYISSGPATVLSLTHSLYRFKNGKIEYNNSIVRLLSKRGYHTNWISNQGIYGGADSPVSLAGKQADEFHFVKNGSSNKFLYSPDEKMLPLVSEALNHKGKKAIFIHLMGSHPMACVRTSGQYDTFFRSKEESCYVQSIKNTDALLSHVYGMLGQNSQSWAMMYFADHGLRVVDKGTNEERQQHSDRYQNDYDVPLFVTTSGSKQSEKITAPRSGFDLIPLITQLVGINETSTDVQCNLYSEEVCRKERLVLKKDGTRVPYNALPREEALY